MKSQPTLPPDTSAPVQRGFAARMGALPRRTKQMLLLGGDACCIPLVMLASVALARGEWVAPSDAVLASMAAAVLAALPLYARVGLYRAVLRFMGQTAASAVALGTLATSAVLAGFSVAGVLDLSLPSIIIFAALLLIYTGASRMALRWLVLPGRKGRLPLIIYGAGESGSALAAALSQSRDVVPAAFVDDDPALQGAVAAGLEVHPATRLAELVALYGARKVLLAMPRLTRTRRREILSQLEPLGVHVQTIPSLSDLVVGRAGVEDLREVDVADLLGRDAVPPDPELLGACIVEKVVLVTGAGGSIGSELCRQILRLRPKRLLLLEMSELALYQVERNLRGICSREGLRVEVVALLGNAHHKYRVREIMQTYAVQTVYHAAAYKHVPIVEHNIIEGLHNNVFSTWHTAEAALECRVETFVLISTDKAVNPTNVMGATKRFAEIVLQGLQQRTSSTRFCMVRFGNVLESSGSVVPLFREQIAAGGPVTVTHPDVIRYFMTIPEAVQLVLQAGSLAEGGDVLVLDMGKPVRIDNLARRMINLSGFSVRDASNPGGDIEIVYTGLRPAEKLFEELLIGTNVTGTRHSMIMRAVEPGLAWTEVQSLLEELGVAMRRFDCDAARAILARAVREYSPQEGIQDLVWTASTRPSAVVDFEAKVAEIYQARRARPPTS